MSDRLKKDSVFKSKTCEEGETFYTIIIGRRWFSPRWPLPEIHKTATVYKNWEDDSSKLEVSIKNFDFRNYFKKINERSLESASEEEINELEEQIEGLSENTKRAIYDDKKKNNYLYAFEMQNISRLDESSKDLSNKLYKKVLSFTNILHL